MDITTVYGTVIPGSSPSRRTKIKTPSFAWCFFISILQCFLDFFGMQQYSCVAICIPNSLHTCLACSSWHCRLAKGRLEFAKSPHPPCLQKVRQWQKGRVLFAFLLCFLIIFSHFAKLTKLQPSTIKVFSGNLTLTPSILK